MLEYLSNNLLKWEISQILLIQKVFEPIEPYLEYISVVSNDRFLHTYVFPFILAFSVEKYINIVVLASISHINIILLKWIFAGSRPYWWINETDSLSIKQLNIRQTHLTCETSAGNPSDHVMLTASVLFYLIRTSFLQSSWVHRLLGPIFKYFVWNLYAGILGLISISRMYFACHFFHQCVSGICFGIVISYLLQHCEINRRLIGMGRINGVFLGICLLLLCVSVYYSHYLLHHDPQWAVKKAFNWCKDPYNIKPETTPIFSLVREFGLLFGLLICSPLQKRINTQLYPRRGLLVVIGIVCINKYLIGQIPRFNGPLIFYSATFFANFLFIIVFVNLVPFIAKNNQKNKSN